MNFSEPRCAAGTIAINSSTSLYLARSLFTDMAQPTKLSDFISHLAAIHDAAYLMLLPQTSHTEAIFKQAETQRISNSPSGDAILRASTLFFLNTFRHDAAAADDDETTRAQHADIYEATGRMLLDLATEEQRYLDNMALLLADLKGKWKNELIETGSWHRTALHMGETGIASARALADLVGDHDHRHATAPDDDDGTRKSDLHDDARKRSYSHEGRKRSYLHDDGGKKYLGEIARYWRQWAGTGEARVYEEAWCYVAGRALVQE